MDPMGEVSPPGNFLNQLSTPENIASMSLGVTPWSEIFSTRFSDSKKRRTETERPNKPRNPNTVAKKNGFIAMLRKFVSILRTCIYIYESYIYI